MSERKKTYYRKGMKLFHNESKEQILFMKWNDNGSASCLHAKTKAFLTIPRDEMDTQYTSYSSLEAKARERRKTEIY